MTSLCTLKYYELIRRCSQFPFYGSFIITDLCYVPFFCALWMCTDAEIVMGFLTIFPFGICHSDDRQYGTRWLNHMVRKIFSSKVRINYNRYNYLFFELLVFRVDSVKYFALKIHKKHRLTNTSILTIRSWHWPNWIDQYAKKFWFLNRR